MITCKKIKLKYRHKTATFHGDTKQDNLERSQSEQLKTAGSRARDIANFSCLVSKTVCFSFSGWPFPKFPAGKAAAIMMFVGDFIGGIFWVVFFVCFVGFLVCLFVWELLLLLRVLSFWLDFGVLEVFLR